MRPAFDLPRASGDARRADRSDDRLDLAAMASWLKPLASPLRLEILRYLRHPHYLEEVASHLGLTRQATRRHLDQLVAIGALERRPGVRSTGPVTEYVTSGQALFRIHDKFELLGSLSSTDAVPNAVTLPATGAARRGGLEQGPALCVVRGMETGRLLRLDGPGRDHWVVGRDGRCQIALPWDPFVSTRHAELRREGRRFLVTDLRSTNGSQVNWSPLLPGASVPLGHGDLLGFGRTLLLYWNREA